MTTLSAIPTDKAVRDKITRDCPRPSRWTGTALQTTKKQLINPMTPEERLKIEEKVVEMLRTVYDPELPVDIYSLGLVYKIDLEDDGSLHIDMTLTSPNCPAAEFLVEDARLKLESIDGVKNVDINIVYEPEWNKDMMSEEAKLDLGFL